MIGFSFSSLRARLLLLVLLSIIPALGLILYTASEQRRSAAAEAKDYALQLARSFSSSQNELIESARQLLIALARMPVVRDGNTAECSALFADLLKQYPRYNNFVATKPNGDVFCSAVPLSRQVNLADRPHFQAAVRTRDLAISDYVIARTTGKAIISFAYPVVDSAGQIKAVVFAGVDLEWLNALVAKTDLPAGTTLTVIDRKGTVLARFPHPEKFVGKSMAEMPLIQTILSRAKGTAEVTGTDGVARLYGFSPLGDTGGAYVSIGIPKDVAFAAANRILTRNLIGLGIVGALALLAAWFGADIFVLQRLKVLLDATTRLRGGDLKARSGLPYTEGELGQLARVFDEMAAALQNRQEQAKRSEEEIQRQLQRVTILREINLATTSTLDLHSVLNVLMEKIDLFLPYTAVLLWLFNWESGQLERAACWNLDEREWKQRGLTGTPSLVQAAIEGETPVVARNVQTDARTLDPAFYRKHGLVSYLGVPLLVKGEVLGVLVFLTREEHEFGSEEVQFLSMVAGQAAIAIHNSQLHEETERRRREAEELARVGQSLTESLDMTALGERIVTSVRELLGVKASMLRLLQTDGSLRTLASSGESFSQTSAGDVLPSGTGLASVAVAEGKPIWSADVLNEPRIRLTGQMRDYQLRSGTRSMIAAPLCAREKVIGSLGLADRTGRIYSESQVALVQTFADQAALALENARLYEEAQSNLQRMRALYEIGTATGSTLDLHAVLDLLIEKADFFLPYGAGLVWLANKESGLFERTACWNVDEKDWKGRGLGMSPLVKAAIKDKSPVIVKDLRTDPRSVDTDFCRRNGLVSYLGIPLIVKGEVLGVIVFLTKQEHQFSQPDVEFLSTLAAQVATAIYNSQLHEQAKQQASELEKANKVKDEFLGFVSHELRTPLNVVIGYALIMQDKLLGEISPEQEKILGKMLTRSRELLDMINSLLEVTRIEAGRVRVESDGVNLDRFMEDLKSAYDVPTGEELTLSWAYPPDLPVVRTDSEKLRHILQNLINNAIKFTEKGSVKVSVRRNPEGKQVEFTVADTGIGIPQESFPVIFEMFRQVNGPHAKSGSGVGLGLHIAQQFTEMLGGKIAVESEVGKGSTFTVTIPCEC